MLSQHRKTKFNKIQKGSLKKYNFKHYHLLEGVYGLKAQESGSISAKQLESARQAIARKMKRRGKIWVKISPGLPVTKKPNETRMGKGKGAVQYWISRIRGGSIIFELTSIPRKIALSAFRTGAAKLPIRTKIIKMK